MSLLSALSQKEFEMKKLASVSNVCKRVSLGIFASAMLVIASDSQAIVSQTPLFLTQGVEPQVMLSLSNDHQLFFEAYPDYLDLNDDGQPDLTYGHDNDYYGYFDSYKCYDYNTSTDRFVPAAETSNKYCDSVAGDWSGNFLNYLTMSRMDVVRKILFGGYRRIDSATQTVLERAYVPTDAHSWVKFYDGGEDNDLEKLTPFAGGGSIIAGSDSEITPNTSNIEFDISSNVSEFMDSVQVGDQVRIYSASSILNLFNSGESYMLGSVRSVDSGDDEITVTVARAVGGEKSNWKIENLSRSGISFCNTTNNASLNDGEVVPTNKPPRLSVARGNYGLWSANERYQCRWSEESNNENANNIGVTGFAANDRNPRRAQVGLGLNNYNVRVEVCMSGLVGTERCKEYPNGNLKPIGLLQQYGDDNEILFGLLSGSYLKNKSGGVLRKNVTGFGDEVNVGTDGTFQDAPTTGGIVNSLNLLRMYGYGSDGVYTGNSENCPFGLKSFSDGQCMSWGNPQSEIFLESIRYFAGAGSTEAYAFTGKDKLDGLRGQAWNDTLNEDLRCAPLNVINFNSSAASYDRDQLQSASDIAGIGGVVDIRALVTAIGESEGINGKEWFVGETSGSNNQLCTSKVVGSLAEAAGLCPEAPRLAAGFDSVGIANYAYENDIRPNLTGDQNVKTFAVALAPAVPRIDIPRPATTERAVTILPACQNTEDDGSCVIVDFKVISQDLEAGTGLFLVNWEAAEQGGDYDQDMYGTIEYTITNSTLEITTRVAQQSSSRPLAFGYVLNGTEKNGFHAHSGINGYDYNDPTGVLECDNCRRDDPATSVTYTLSSGETRDGLLESPMFYAAKWSGYDKQGNFPTESESWDADGDGLPDNYYFAIDPSKLARDLELVFADILRSSSSAASLASNSTSLRGDSAVYRASFNSQNWSGDLRAFAVDEDDGQVANSFTWSAAAQLDVIPPNEIAARRIITNTNLSNEGQVAGELLSTSGTPFKWDELQGVQKDSLRQNSDGTELDEADGKRRLEYLRGDRSNERTLTNTDGIFRERDGRLGDIINSDPQFAHKQNFGFGNLSETAVFSTATGYNAFRDSEVYQNRPPIVLVGANDGMLHAFNASEGDDGGKEMFAYVASDVIGNLGRLSEFNYAHRYYVDGSPRVTDAWLGSGLGWRTIAVGTTGAGGNSLFALDITNPETVSEDNLLWEFSHPNLYRPMQQPSTVAMPDGNFAVVVSSGYSDTAQVGPGRVWVLNAGTGRPIRTFELPSGQLGSPLTVDLDGDRIVDRIYVGDSEGQLWRLDTADSEEGQWGVPNSLRTAGNPVPLFTAPGEQPITGQLQAAFNENREPTVYFGTGSFLRQGDNVVGADPDVQAIYAIFDRDEPVLVADLLEQEILTRVVQNGNRLTGISDNELSDQSGWYMNLVWKESLDGPGPQGERVVTRAQVRGARVLFTSLIPSEDPCSAGGTSWFYEVDAFSGSRLDFSVFDVNGDGLFNGDDFIEVEVAGEKIRIPSSGLDLEMGIVNQPVVSTGSDGAEFRIFSGSNSRQGAGDDENEDFDTRKAPGALELGRQNWEQIR